MKNLEWVGKRKNPKNTNSGVVKTISLFFLYRDLGLCRNSKLKMDLVGILLRQ